LQSKGVMNAQLEEVHLEEVHRSSKNDKEVVTIAQLL
jgi:hypothetical protein